MRLSRPHSAPSLPKNQLFPGWSKVFYSTQVPVESKVLVEGDAFSKSIKTCTSSFSISKYMLSLAFSTTVKAISITVYIPDKTEPQLARFSSFATVKAVLGPGLHPTSTLPLACLLSVSTGVLYNLATALKLLFSYHMQFITAASIPALVQSLHFCWDGSLALAIVNLWRPGFD